MTKDMLKDLKAIKDKRNEPIWTCEYMTFSNEKWHKKRHCTIEEAFAAKKKLMNNEVPLTQDIIDKMKSLKEFDDDYINDCIEAGMVLEYEYFEIYNDDLDIRILTEDYEIEREIIDFLNMDTQHK